jgi:signal transduction histidine kinase
MTRMFSGFPARYLEILGRLFSSPTGRLMLGLAVTLTAVAVFSWYALGQIDGLKRLQTQIVERNRRDSLQLLRIQNNLNALGLAMRDMLDNDEPYPLEAWKGQFDRHHADLDDALRIERELTSDQDHVADLLRQFWTSSERMFALAREGRVDHARVLLRASLEPQQAAATAAIARRLTENNRSEEEAVGRIAQIYSRVEQNVYVFLAAMLVAISLTSAYLIYSNGLLFRRMATLSEQRSDLAHKLFGVQEEVLHSISRELHDEFGQILTAIGAMLGRLERRAASQETAEGLREIRDIAQSALEKVRTLSQALHPTTLDDAGLEKAMDWHLSVFEKQTGIRIHYEKEGSSPAIANRIAIHVYRVLQEALNNVARHSGAQLAEVRVSFSPERLRLEVEDHGAGFPAPGNGRRGIGMLAMRERAELLRGRIDFLAAPAGGALVRLEVPLD